MLPEYNLAPHLEQTHGSDVQRDATGLDDYDMPSFLKTRKKLSKSVTRHFLPSNLSISLPMRSRGSRAMWRQAYINVTAYALYEPVLCSWASTFVAFLLTLLIVWMVAHVRQVQDPDKELLPWREMCAKQPAFVNAAVEQVEPVDLLVGVLTTDAKFERRSVIRDTYMRHTVPKHASSGRPLGNVQVKFILGRPRREYAERVAMEMELYNDIVVLDIKETQWSRKTYEFFRWAAENATVPVLVPGKPTTPSKNLVRIGQQAYEVRWKLVDYVLKADDDAFIVLDELERRLRALPRHLLHWGYKIADWFMGGELYALSYDLVEFIARSQDIARWPSLKEDEQVAQWLRLHPQANNVTWASEHCWIYDHPRAKTPYAHGFLFPNLVNAIKHEYIQGLSEEEIVRRGGAKHAWSYSTTTRWGMPYRSPQRGMSMEESVEALVEGGGRWDRRWHRTTQDVDAPPTMPQTEALLMANTSRLISPSHDPELGLAVYPQEVPTHTRLEGVGAARESHVWGPPMYEYAETLRSERYVNDTLGGTVAVHFLKKEVWFYETMLALVGTRHTWPLGSAANAWRMYNSPSVQPYSQTYSWIAVS